jgi:hypothetical protein
MRASPNVPDVRDDGISLASPSGGRGLLLVALACALLSGASFGVLVLDFGAHVDGVGIGLEWSRPLGTGGEYGLRAGAVLATSIVQGVLSLTLFGRISARSFGVLGLFGVGAVGVVFGLVVAGRALPAWWKLGCDRGHAYACYAAAGVTDGPESQKLDERACAGDVGNACLRIARADSSRVPLLCAERARLCADGRERPPFSTCRALADICPSVDRPLP